MNQEAAKMTLQERLISATSSSDLSVSLEARGDADYLISAGLQPAKLGRLVYQLMAEWDTREKPRPLTEAQLQQVAAQMPRKSRGRLDMIGARIAEGKWREQQRMQVLSKLPTFPKLMDRHAGFLPWVLTQGIEDARNKLADVLLWWCDRKCHCCGGITLEGVDPCGVCAGSGERDVPHEAEGRRISEHIAAAVDRSRTGTIATLKRMRELKALAAARI